MVESCYVTEDEANQRLDLYLSRRFPDYSRSYFQIIIGQKGVLLNGREAIKRTTVQAVDRIEIISSPPPEMDIEPEPIPLDILFEDTTLIIVNKPSGMVVHPAVGHWKGTFVNALLHHCHLEDQQGLRPGIVHRLDKDTSGVMVAAKSRAAHQQLVSLFSQQKMMKEYVAITRGNPGQRLIEGNIGRHPRKRQRMALLPEGGKPAITRVHTEAYNAQYARVRLFPQTGRTHQLRVHLQSIGTPILGDPLYGDPRSAPRLLLHAHRLSFTHPLTGAALTYEAPIPKEFCAYNLNSLT